MNEGVDLRSLRSRFPNAQHEKAKELFHELESHQLIHPLLNESSHLRLTNTGRLLADQIGVQLLERMA
jgi:coproporphyrinogen III oxidase-like Fe-S oxidoreductase